MQLGLRVHTWSEAFSISLDYVWKREGGMKSIQQLKELNINIYFFNCRNYFELQDSWKYFSLSYFDVWKEINGIKSIIILDLNDVDTHFRDSFRTNPIQPSSTSSWAQFMYYIIFYFLSMVQTHASYWENWESVVWRI